MTPRERVQLALSHKEPDRVPIDLGGTICTTITRTAHRRLKEFLGIHDESEIITHPMMDTVVPHEEIRRRYEVDFVTVRMKPPSKSSPLGGGFFSAGAEMGEEIVDEYGTRYRKAGYDYAPVGYPLQGADIENLEKYSWPNPYDPGRIATLKEEAEKAFQFSNYAVVADIMCGGPFEQALWLRGFEDFLVDLHWNKKFAKALLEKITEIDIGFWDVYLSAVGNYVHVVAQGDDLGTQSGPYIGPEIYREFIYPCHRKIFEFIKKKTKAKIFLHSCGGVYPLIPFFIEEGVDILNPVQTGAKDMEPRKLKKEFGKEIVFWGGGLDVQKLLFLSEKEIEEEVKKNLDILAPGGGYVFATTHNLPHDAPPKKIEKIYLTVLRYFEK